MNALFPSKLHSLSEAITIREQENAPVVLTNGCFDLLHVGHILSLNYAAQYGKLWIALNGDASIKKLKGASRPIFSENERAYMLSALECVSGIFIFNSERPDMEIEKFRPNIYVKSADYNLNNLNPDEKRSLEKISAKIYFSPLIEGFSTSKIIQKIHD